MKSSISRQTQKIFGMLGLMTVIIIMVAVYVFRESISQLSVLGFFGLLLACFAANATVLLPAPSTLIVMEFASIFNPVWVGVIGGIGAALGELTGYLTGTSSQAVFDFNKDKKIFRMFKRHPSLWIFVFAFIPLPLFDVAGVMAGILKIPLWKFFSACVFGKILKMLLLACLIWNMKQYWLNIDNFSLQELIGI